MKIKKIQSEQKAKESPIYEKKKELTKEKKIIKEK